MSDTKLLSPNMTSVDTVASSSSEVVSSSASSLFSSESVSSVVVSAIVFVNMPPTVNPPCSSPSVELEVLDTLVLKYYFLSSH